MYSLRHCCVLWNGPVCRDAGHCGSEFVLEPKTEKEATTIIQQLYRGNLFGFDKVAF